MYRDTVTLFNRKGSLWYPTVLTGVNLNIDKGVIVKTYGEESKDSVVLNVKNPAVKPFLPPKEWQASEAPTDYITFTSGNNFDFFWNGEWTGAAPVSDDDYGIMNFYDWMNKNKDFVFAITSVGYFSVLPHWEVVGR